MKYFTSLDGQKWITAEQQTLFHVRKTLPRHTNLIEFINVALNAKPFPYLLLEYANAGSVEEWILSEPADRKPLDKQRVMEGIVRGLALAHEKGIAHRDLKPANIMLSGTSDLVPKIADFGLGNVNPVASSETTVKQGVAEGTASIYRQKHISPLPSVRQRRTTSSPSALSGINSWWSGLNDLRMTSPTASKPT